MMVKTSLSQKALLFLLSLFFILVSLEISLRIGGWTYLMLQEKHNKRISSSGTVKVLCVGESTTAMDGEDSYPSQLEKILNERSEKTFTVINKGVPGIGSGFIVEHISQWIDEYKPDIIVAMMGVNDENKYIPLDEATRRAHPLSFLLESRTYKLFRWLKQSLANSRKSNHRDEPQEVVVKNTNPKENQDGLLKTYIYALHLLNKNNDPAAEALLKYILSKEQDLIPHHKLMYNLAEALVKQKKYNEFAQTVMVQRLSEIPYDLWFTIYIPQLCKENKGTNEITSALNRMIEADPDEISLYSLLGACRAEAGDQKSAEELYAKAATMRLSMFTPQLRASYLRLAEILLQKGARTIFMQYPLRDIRVLHHYLSPPYDLDRFYFVENKTNFEHALGTGSYNDYFKDRFAGDFGHCTVAGNRLVAENVAGKILRDIVHED